VDEPRPPCGRGEAAARGSLVRVLVLAPPVVLGVDNCGGRARGLSTRARWRVAGGGGLGLGRVAARRLRLSALSVPHTEHSREVEVEMSGELSLRVWTV